MKHNTRKAKLGKALENPRMEARARKLRVGNLVRLSEKFIFSDRAAAKVIGSSSVGVVEKVNPYVWDILVRFPAKTRFWSQSKSLLFGFYRDDLELVKR